MEEHSAKRDVEKKVSHFASFFGVLVPVNAVFFNIKITLTSSYLRGGELNLLHGILGSPDHQCPIVINAVH